MSTIKVFIAYPSLLHPYWILFNHWHHLIPSYLGQKYHWLLLSSLTTSYLPVCLSTYFFKIYCKTDQGHPFFHLGHCVRHCHLCSRPLGSACSLLRILSFPTLASLPAWPFKMQIKSCNSLLNIFQGLPILFGIRSKFLIIAHIAWPPPTSPPSSPFSHPFIQCAVPPLLFSLLGYPNLILDSGSLHTLFPLPSWRAHPTHITVTQSIFVQISAEMFLRRSVFHDQPHSLFQCPSPSHSLSFYPVLIFL